MRIKHISIFFLSLTLNLIPFALSHAAVDIGLGYGAQTGLGDADPRTTIAAIIRVALGLLGILTTCIMMYAGFKWMTAGGNEDEVASAKKMIYSAVLGLIVILSSYAITSFVIGRISKVTVGYDLVD